MKRVVAIIILIYVSLVGLYAANYSVMNVPSYKEFFTDPYLQVMIGQVLESNLDLRSAQMNIVEARAALGSARSALFPQVTLDANGEIQSFNGLSAKTYKIGATPVWELDIFGRQKNTKKRAEASLEASFAYVQTVQTELVSTLAKCYYTLLMLDEQKQISDRSLQNWQTTMKMLENLYDAGQSNGAAVLQSQANILGLQTSILSLDKNIADMESSICILLNVSFKHINRSATFEQHLNEDLATNGIPLQMIDNRPDVRQARLKLIEAGYGTKIARAQFYPQLTLSGSFGWTNNGLAIMNPGKFLLDALGGLTMPLLNQGTIKADVQVAEAQWKQAVFAFQKSVLVAGQEVNDALIEWQSACQQTTLCNQQISALRECVSKTKLLMENSSATYIEVLTAEQSLFAAETSLTQYKYSRMEALILLYKSTGGMFN